MIKRLKREGKPLKILILILAIIAGVSSVQWFMLERKVSDHQAKSETMESHAIELERKVLALETQLAEAEKRSIDKIADDLNDTFVEGWGSMLEQFKKKLEETAEDIENQFELQEHYNDGQEETTIKNDERT